MGQFLFRNCVRERKIGSFAGSRKAKNVWAGALAGLMFSVAIFGVMPSGGASALDGHIGHGALGGQAQITPRADDKVFYTTSEGVSVKSQNNNLYTTLDGKVYAVLGQGDGTMNSYVGGFTELEYIESTGIQYINTGVASASTLEWDMVGNFTSATSSHNSQMGAYYNSYRLYLCSLADTGAKFCYGLGYNDHSRIMTGDYKTHTWAYQNGVYYIDSSSWTKTLTTAWTYNLYLFACNAANTAKYWCWFKMQSCKIWNNGILVRDFVPALCPICGQAGLYDKANGKFYDSETDTKFVAGPNAIAAAAVLHAPVYDNFSYASGALGEDLAYRTVEGFAAVGGVERGYLLCQSQSDESYLKLRI